MKGRYWTLLGILLGAAVVSVPYLLIRDVTSYWANYLYWTLLTLVVLVIGIWKVRKWGD